MLERNNCVKYLGILFDERYNFSFQIAEVVRKLSELFSVVSLLGHFGKKPVLLQYYNTYNKPVLGYGLLTYGCTSKNRLKPVFILDKKMLRQIRFKARYYPSAELFDKLNVSNVFDYYIVEVLNIFLKSVCSVQSTEYPNSLFKRKMSNVQPRKAQLNLSWPNESCSVQSHNSLRYRGAKLINFFLEPGFVQLIFR